MYIGIFYLGQVRTIDKNLVFKLQQPNKLPNIYFTWIVYGIGKKQSVVLLFYKVPTEILELHKIENVILVTNYLITTRKDFTVKFHTAGWNVCFNNMDQTSGQGP